MQPTKAQFDFMLEFNLKYCVHFYVLYNFFYYLFTVSPASLSPPIISLFHLILYLREFSPRTVLVSALLGN